MKINPEFIAKIMSAKSSEIKEPTTYSDLYLADTFFSKFDRLANLNRPDRILCLDELFKYKLDKQILKFSEKVKKYVPSLSIEMDDIVGMPDPSRYKKNPNEYDIDVGFVDGKSLYDLLDQNLNLQQNEALQRFGKLLEETNLATVSRAIYGAFAAKLLIDHGLLKSDSAETIRQGYSQADMPSRLAGFYKKACEKLDNNR